MVSHFPDISQATASSISLEDEITSSKLIIMVSAIMCLQMGHANNHSPPSSAKVQKA